MKLKAIISVALATLIVLATLHAVHTVNTNNQQLHLKEIKLRNVQAELNQLDSQYQKLQSDNSKTVQEKQAEIQRLLDKQKKLERQLEARRLLKAQEAKAYAASRSQASYGCHTGNWYKDYIYSHESGCDRYARNTSSGACGLGQAWPCSKLPCSLSDYVCQDRWFTNYAISRYGSWAAAYRYWVAHRNW
jgi:hypothetical protein